MKRLIEFSGIVALVTSVFSLISYFLLTQDKFHSITIQLSLAALALIIFTLAGGLKKLLTSTNKRKSKLNFGLSLYSFLFLVLLVFINYLAITRPFFSYDSTEQKIFTLAPQTQKIISNLKKEVQIKAFFVGAKLEKEEGELLKLIASFSSKVSYEILDPEKNPSLVEKYKITQDRTLILSFKDQELAREARILGDLSEETVVNALLKLQRDTDKIIYYISAHGEPELENQKETGYFLLAQGIVAENLRLRTIKLLGAGEIPKDASAIILSTPKKALLEDEIALINKYLANGGNAVFLAELSSAEQINQITKPLGIEVGKNMLIDLVAGLAGSNSLGVQPMITSFTNHPINESFNQSILLYAASSVYPTLEGRASGKVAELAFSSQKSWAETNLELILQDKPVAKFDPEDEKGPLPVAVAFQGNIQQVTKENPKPPESRIVVFGDSDFVNNFNIRELFNRDYFLNALNWVVGEEKSISIRAKTLRESTKGITSEQFSAMFLLTAIVFPELVLLLGLFIWWRRKS